MVQRIANIHEMYNQWASHVSALREDLKVTELREKTLEQSHGQLTMELEATRVREQAAREEISSLLS